ncbi:DUF6777 domain-containing protein [Streptomyces sp. NPDC001780]
MRSSIRRRHAALLALLAGVLVVAGCGGDDGAREATVDAKELYLQRATAREPAPFTPSTAADPPRPVPGPERSPARRGALESGGGATLPVRTARALPGSTPGLYAGVRSAATCDVERQIRYLTEEPVTARAFAEGAGITPAVLPGYLRGLTPVSLRADTRVTNHAFRGGTATAFQAVLQEGTAVMVDDRGLPRVRCACGSPLGRPVATRGQVRHKGGKWASYRPDRVVVVRPAPQAVTSLIIADLAGEAWIERRTGTDGESDAFPEAPPAYGPGADITDPSAVRPPGAPLPEAPPGTGRERPSAGDSSGDGPWTPGDPGSVELTGPQDDADLLEGPEPPLGAAGG